MGGRNRVDPRKTKIGPLAGCNNYVAGRGAAPRTPSIPVHEKRAVTFFGWVFFLVSLGSRHVRPMGRTCEEPNELGLAPIGVRLNDPRRVRSARRQTSRGWRSTQTRGIVAATPRTRPASRRTRRTAAPPRTRSQTWRTCTIVIACQRLRADGYMPAVTHQPLSLHSDEYAPTLTRRRSRVDDAHVSTSSVRQT